MSNEAGILCFGQYIMFNNKLSLFLAASREAGVLSPGQRFMIDLLVSSLMADGGLEVALNTAFKKETHAIEEIKVHTLTIATNICSLFPISNRKLITDFADYFHFIL